ncbi:hypothetical protein Cgig2_011636 [Carnegiea gigantea]|uniref:Uncharacterized protein n=1 Tax=Carnegiea gigantea TaxID=171969 RepID=A0A9Q1KH28_9CARY|nr:hypothetical protein Cgig2_011636 [Carnegiea gigantea]
MALTVTLLEELRGIIEHHGVKNGLSHLRNAGLIGTLFYYVKELTEKPKKKKKADKKWKSDSRSNKELNSKKHVVHDKQTEKEKEKEELPNQLVDKVAEKWKPSQDPADKPLTKKNALSDNEGCRKSAKKAEHKEKHLQKAPTKLENKENGEKAGQPKKQNSKEKPVNDGQSDMIQQLSNAAVRKGHVSDVEPSNNSDSKDNDLTYECEEVNNENEHVEVKEELAIRQPLNEAQAEVVKSVGFASFLKFNLKQIPWKFSKWLVESFDPYAMCFKLPDGQKFSVTTFDVYATLGVPLGGTEIIEINKSLMDEEYYEVHAAWLKEWKLQKNAPKLTPMPEFIMSEKDGGESFKRNFIIYLVNCFFSGAKNRYCSKSILKYVKNVSQIASLNWCQFVLNN